MHKIANVCLSYYWYRLLGPKPQLAEFFLIIFSFANLGLFFKFQLDPMSNGLDIGSKCCCFSPRLWPYRPFFGQITFYENIHFAKDVVKKISAHAVLPVPK